MGKADTESTEYCLFEGGAADGLILPVERGARRWHVADIDSRQLFGIGGADEFEPLSTFSQEYQRSRDCWLEDIPIFRLKFGIVGVRISGPDNPLS